MTLASAVTLFLFGWTAFAVALGSAFAALRYSAKSKEANAQRLQRVETQLVVDDRWASLRRVS